MSQLSIEHIFQNAVQHHQAGQLPQAQELYQQILQQQPNHADTLHYLGVLAHQLGQNDNAIDLLTRALALQPDWPEAYCNLGEAHRAHGQLPQAIAAYRQAIALNPNLPAAYSNLGIALKSQGQLDEASAAFRQAITLNPNYAQAHFNLGNTCKDQNHFDAAVAAYRQAIALKPNYPEAYSNLGIALKGKGQLDEALAACRQAVALNPQLPEAHNNLGIVLIDQGQRDAAIAACRQAIALKPNFSQAYCNLGIALCDQGQYPEALEALHHAIALNSNFPEAHGTLGKALKNSGQFDAAIAAFHQAIALQPNYPEAYGNLGDALHAQGQFDDAIAAFRQAIAQKPNVSESHYNLGVALQEKDLLNAAIQSYRQAIALDPKNSKAHCNLGNALKDKGQLDDALALYHQSIALDPTYPNAYCSLGNILKDQGQLDQAIAAYRQAIALDPDYMDAHSNLLLTLNYHPATTQENLYREALRWAQQHAAPFKKFILPHTNDRNPERRLRIGYVSPDLRDHVAARFLLPLLAQHNHQQFEIFAYANVKKPDAVTDRLRQHTDTWRDIVNLKDDAAAALIREDRIDILMDLSGHTALHRLPLFARKPAPIQATWLGYPGTTGLDTIDYRFTDIFIDPPGINDAWCTERLIRLPQTVSCYLPPLPDPGLTPPPVQAAGHITFGCFNNFCKVSRPTLTTWARILHALPNAQLLLFAHEGSHRQHVQQHLAQAGLDPQRLRFVGFGGLKYLDFYQQIDIVLDPFPYTGSSSTFDALFMGVPVITLAGATIVSRMSTALLSNVNRTQWIATSEDQYLSLALTLAQNIPHLTQLRSTLRTELQQSPLMDAPAFASAMESAYRQMWHQWCTP